MGVAEEETADTGGEDLDQQNTKQYDLSCEAVSGKEGNTKLNCLAVRNRYSVDFFMFAALFEDAGTLTTFEGYSKPAQSNNSSLLQSATHVMFSLRILHKLHGYSSELEAPPVCLRVEVTQKCKSL